MILIDSDHLSVLLDHRHRDVPSSWRSWMHAEKRRLFPLSPMKSIFARGSLKYAESTTFISKSFPTCGFRISLHFFANERSSVGTSPQPMSSSDCGPHASASERKITKLPPSRWPMTPCSCPPIFATSSKCPGCSRKTGWRNSRRLLCPTGAVYVSPGGVQKSMLCHRQLWHCLDRLVSCCHQ
jgi:hypothetical protein